MKTELDKLIGALNGRVMAAFEISDYDLMGLMMDILNWIPPEFRQALTGVNAQDVMSAIKQMAQSIPVGEGPGWKRDMRERLVAYGRAILLSRVNPEIDPAKIEGVVARVYQKLSARDTNGTILGGAPVGLFGESGREYAGIYTDVVMAFMKAGIGADEQAVIDTVYNNVAIMLFDRHPEGYGQPDPAVADLCAKALSDAGITKQTASLIYDSALAGLMGILPPMPAGDPHVQQAYLYAAKERIAQEVKKYIRIACTINGGMPARCDEMVNSGKLEPS